MHCGLWLVAGSLLWGWSRGCLGQALPFSPLVAQPPTSAELQGPELSTDQQGSSQVRGLQVVGKKDSGTGPPWEHRGHASGALPALLLPFLGGLWVTL